MGRVVDVKEVKARKAKTRGVQKHMVVFRNPDVVINGGDGDTVFPQILLTNSHDGKNAFTFTAGLCSVWYVRMVWLFQPPSSKT